MAICYWEQCYRWLEFLKVIGTKLLDEFAELHSNIRSQLSMWIHEVEEFEWNSPNDIKARYAQASFLAENRVVFNIKGNNYRIDTKINFNSKVVLIKRIGTHAEYSKWKFK